MWIVYVLVLVFGLTILDCTFDMIRFEKFLLDNEDEFNLLNYKEDLKNGKHNKNNSR